MSAKLSSFWLLGSIYTYVAPVDVLLELIGFPSNNNMPLLYDSLFNTEKLTCSCFFITAYGTYYTQLYKLVTVLSINAVSIAWWCVYAVAQNNLSMLNWLSKTLFIKSSDCSVRYGICLFAIEPYVSQNNYPISFIFVNFVINVATPELFE